MPAIPEREYRKGKRKSLFELLGEVPTLVRELVETEIELLKAELLAKLKVIGIGAGLIAIAAILALLFFGVLLTAAILALSLVMPGWLAALLVGFVLLVAIAILVLVGVQSVKKAMPPMPTETIDSVKADIDVIKGVGKRATV